YIDDTGTNGASASSVDSGTLAASVLVVEGCSKTAYFDNFNNVDEVLTGLADFIVPGWTESGGDDANDTAIVDGSSDGAGIRYLRLRQGGTVTKTNISTAGLKDIRLQYKWGKDTDSDVDNGNLLVEWKLSSS